VIDRRHFTLSDLRGGHRLAAPFALPFPTPLFPLPRLSPLLPYSYGHSYTTATHQPLCNQSVTHSFDLHGGVPSSRSRLPIPHSLSPTCPLQNACFALRMVLRNRPKVPTLSDGIPFLVTPLRTLSHFFAFFCTHQKFNSFLFKRFRTLCKKHRGWVPILCGYSVFEGRDNNILRTCVWPHTIPGHDF